MCYFGSELVLISSTLASSSPMPQSESNRTVPPLETNGAASSVPQSETDGSVLQSETDGSVPPLETDGAASSVPQSETDGSVLQSETDTGALSQPALIASTSSSDLGLLVITPLRSLITVPKVQRVSRGKRAVAHAKMITDSPYKTKLESISSEKKRKEDSKKRKAEVKPKTCDIAVKKHKTVSKKTRGKKVKAAADEEDARCLYCDDLYSTSVESWIQCQGPCHKWSHISCAGSEEQFMCEFCM